MFFKKKEKEKEKKRTFLVDDLFVINAEIVLSTDDSTGNGPKCLSKYFIAEKKGSKYFEVFSGVEIEQRNETEGFIFAKFDIPFVVDVEPLRNYLDSADYVSAQNIFYNIELMNAEQILFPED